MYKSKTTSHPVFNEYSVDNDRLHFRREKKNSKVLQYLMCLNVIKKYSAMDKKKIVSKNVLL